MKKKYVFVGLVLFIASFLIFLWFQQPKSGEVPVKYQALYAKLEQKLDKFNQRLDSQWDGKKSPTIFGAELLIANGNRGTSLLDEENYQYTLLYLDRLQELGVRGVKITIGYPLLTVDFPGSEKYLSFYTKLSQEIRQKRKMKLLIQATALFTESEFSDASLSLKEYYRELTLEDYKQGKREQIEKILSNIQPDYLTVETEPDTMARNTGLAEVNDPKIFRDVVEYQIRGLKKGKTLIGAGVGTWNRKEFVEKLVQISNLDYLELRIYPIVKDYLQNALDYINFAELNNKKVVFGESWLYKASGQEISGGAATAKIFARDTFSFWQPLDQKFLEILVKISRNRQVEFVSPFWTNYFFAYLDYGWTTRLRSPGALLKLANKEAAKNFIAGRFTQTGLKYQELISKQNYD